jgi:hypothetical protein
MLDHALCNEPAHIHGLIVLQAKGRAPYGEADVAREIVISVPLIAYAIV